MVDRVGPNNELDRAEAVDSCFGLSCQWSRGKDPDIARREPDGSRAATNSEEPKSCKWTYRSRYHHDALKRTMGGNIRREGPDIADHLGEKYQLGL
jgi:hypothetical protein